MVDAIATMNGPLKASDDPAVALFDHISFVVRRAGNPSARVHLVDGRSIEGEIIGIGHTTMLLVDKITREIMEVSADQLQSMHVIGPRRGREWLVAAAAVPLATAALVAFSRLSWVHPARGDIMVGFMILLAIVSGAAAIPAVNKGLLSWLTKWRRIYPEA